MKTILSALGFALAFNVISLSSAFADLTLENKTTSPVSVAIAYKDKEGWASEGWWTVKPGGRSTLMKGPLIARYYYIYAVDRQKGGSWGGKSMVCIKDKIFTIRGIDKCAERGFQTQGFFEVDTGEKPDWTVSLSSDKPAPVENNTQAAPVPEANGTTAQ